MNVLIKREESKLAYSSKREKGRMKSKIGILTFHNALNYGAVLQCYALQHYLQEKGHDVEVIDYRARSLKSRKSSSAKRSCTAGALLLL